jgi:CubicO group peptidase (beta-lactamase class C family)
MSHDTLSDVAMHMRERAAVYCESSTIPGYLAGVYHDGDQIVVAHGVANVVTGAPMREDTGFLFGSVTNVLTTTLVLQQVERGVVDLEERVIKYLPQFKLTTPKAAEQIRVRNLLTHTNGIDADLFFPDARGRAALSVFLEGLGQYCGALLGPDEYISYSNGGMIVAGRLLEVVNRSAPSVICLPSDGPISPTASRRRASAFSRLSQPHAGSRSPMTWQPPTFHPSGWDGC